MQVHHDEGVANVRFRPAPQAVRDGLPGSAQAAAAALACWFTFQFQGSRLATLLAG